MKVSLKKGSDLRTTVRKTLEAIADDVRNGIGSKQIIVKPNFVSTSVQLASTHVDQVRGILDFLCRIRGQRIIIAEAASGNTFEAYEKFGYLALEEEYPVTLVDLNKGPFQILKLSDGEGKHLSLGISSLLFARDTYRISAAKLKTHDTVVVTLSVKNMAMGCVCDNDRKMVHRSYTVANRIIAGLACCIWPDLAVIDGTVGMEGDGPVVGSPVHSSVVISSTDALSADRVACEIMGINFHKVGYLHYCAEKNRGEGDLKSIEIVGERLDDCIRPFRLHHRVDEQYGWT